VQGALSFRSCLSVPCATAWDLQITDTSKKSVCFVLFLDAASLQGVHNDSLEVSADGYVGLWRMVVVEGLPYADNRITGRSQDALASAAAKRTVRALPAASQTWTTAAPGGWEELLQSESSFLLSVEHTVCWYIVPGSSVPLVTALELLPCAGSPQVLCLGGHAGCASNADPLYILQRFLIGQKAEFAISQHYHRRCVWGEVRVGPVSQQPRPGTSAWCLPHQLARDDTSCHVLSHLRCTSTPCRCTSLSLRWHATDSSTSSTMRFWTASWKHAAWTA